MSDLTNTLKNSIISKNELFTKDLKRYSVRAIYAGIMLGLGALAATLVAGQIAMINYDLGRLFYGGMFGWGLAMIIFLNAELATGNMMYMGAAVQYKWMPVKRALALVFYCTLMNLVGTVLTAYLSTKTTAFANPEIGRYIWGSIEGKLAKGSGTILIEGILANILVNIAIIGSLRIKEGIGKLVFSLGIIGIFAFFGFEHVIANFVSFTYAWVLNPDIPGFETLNILRQLTMAFIGNFIGGGVMTGMVYAWLNQTKTAYKD